MSELYFEVRHISKYYPGVHALDDVSISFRKGEIHGLLGENGAGKSTLIKVLTGAIQPTDGSIVIGGKEYTSMTPTTAISLGIAVIYQEFNSIPFLSVADNIFFGCEITRHGIRDVKAMNEQTKKICEEIGVEIDPQARVRDLGVAYQQIVEIMKAVSKNARILIMDEPTAPLTNKEIESIYKIMEKLKAKGVTIIYISHRLEEVFRICDRLTVLRDGKYIVTKDIKDTNRKELIAYMVGHELGEKYPESVGPADEAVLEVRNLYTDKLKNINFSLKKGEILGLGGLIGAGRTEIARAIYGADKKLSGNMLLKGQKVNIRSPKDALRYGIGLIPESRKEQGLVLDMKVRENISYSILKRISHLFVVDKKKEDILCNQYRDELRIKCPSLSAQAKTLSGGNQQKVVLAKFLATQCEVLIFDEPTRGIDVSAKQEIYSLMCQLVKQGKSIIMISSELPELIGMSNRILVMSEGKITGELYPSDYSQETILEYASRN